MRVTKKLPPIQGLWIGPRLSLMEQLSIESFLQNGHPYHLYVYDSVENIPKGTTVCNAEEVLPRHLIFENKAACSVNRNVSFSDLFRYKLLMDRGGIYSDLDLVCIRPFDFEQDTLIATELFELAFRSKHYEQSTPPIEILTHSWSPFGVVYRLLNMNVMKVPPGQPLLEKLYNLALGADKELVHHSEIGPQLIGKLYQQTPELFKDTLAPPHWFNPISFSNLRTLLKPSPKPLNILGPEVYAVHLYANIWRSNMHYRQHKPFGPRTLLAPRMDTDAYYSETCLYGALQNRYGIVSPN